MAEKEYIEREALIEEAKHNKAVCQAIADIVDVKDIINNTPAVDVAPVKHGHWVKEKPDVLIHWHCSVCKNCYYLEEPNANYCPNCGAKMDEGEEND